MKNGRSRARGALTLVEVLVVIAIVTLLAGLVMFAVGPGLRLSRTEPTCANNLRQLAVSLNLYMAENDGGVPRQGFVEYEKRRNKPYIRCPLGAPEATYSDAIRRFWAHALGGQDPSAPQAPINARYPAFDLHQDVLFRCQEHGYDGFKKNPFFEVNYGDPASAGRTLGVRLDTSVRRVPYVSCWELGLHAPNDVVFPAALIRGCDRPLTSPD
jgi:hypothetical protein